MIRGAGDVHVDPGFDVKDQTPSGATQRLPDPTADGFVAAPRVPDHALTRLTTAEIAQLTQGGSDVDSVRKNLIAANGNSRVLDPGHLNNLLTQLDTRSFEQKNFPIKLGGRNHPQQELIDTLKKLNTEVSTNANKIYAGEFPSVQDGLISSRYKASAALLQQRLTDPKGTLDDIDELLKLGADPTEAVRGQNALQLAFGDGTTGSLRIKAFERMVTDRKSRMINHSLLNTSLRDGKNALHLMIEQGNVMGVKWLLSHGAYKKETAPQAQKSWWGTAPKVKGESPVDIANKLPAGPAKTTILELLGAVPAKEEPEVEVAHTDTSSNGSSVVEQHEEEFQRAVTPKQNPWQTAARVVPQDLRGNIFGVDDDDDDDGSYQNVWKKFYIPPEQPASITPTTSKPTQSAEEQAAAEKAEFEALLASFMKKD